MKFNSTTTENDTKRDYSKYIVLAIVGAFVAAFFLNIIAKLIVLFVGVLIENWLVALIAIFVLLVLRKMINTKKEKEAELR